MQYLDDTEEEYRLRGNQPGERWWHHYLRKKSPGLAIARQWAGLDQEAELLRQEIAGLRVLISGAAYDLKAAGDRQQDRPQASSLSRVESPAGQHRSQHLVNAGGLRFAKPTEPEPIKY